MIEIKMGVSSDVWPDGARVVGTSGAGIEKMMAEGGHLVTKVNTTWDQMASDKNLIHINNTLANLDSTTQILNSIWNRNQANLNALLDSLALASGDASGVLSENRDDLRASVKNMKQSSEKLIRLTEDVQMASASLRATLDNLNQITSHIRDGKGTVGRLVQDDQVYLHLERTLSSVDSLVEDIKRDPSRYFRFSVF
jgi:phospholipid/cholesterol/gamma-HCH transport system substrate-binding protein